MAAFHGRYEHKIPRKILGTANVLTREKLPSTSHFKYLNTLLIGSNTRYT